MVDGANYATGLYGEEVKKAAEQDIEHMLKENNAVFIRTNTDLFEAKMLPFFDQLIKEGYIKKDIFEQVQALK